jgi:hypothetical protein
MSRWENLCKSEFLFGWYHYQSTSTKLILERFNLYMEILAWYIDSNGIKNKITIEYPCHIHIKECELLILDDDIRPTLVSKPKQTFKELLRFLTRIHGDLSMCWLIAPIPLKRTPDLSALLVLWLTLLTLDFLSSLQPHTVPLGTSSLKTRGARSAICCEHLTV